MADGVLGYMTEFCYRREVLATHSGAVSPQLEVVGGVPYEVALSIASGQAGDYIHPEDREVFEAAIGQLSQEGCGRLTHELRVRQRIDSTHVTFIWIRHTAEVVRDGNGRLYVEGLIANITENKLAQTELRSLRLRYEHLMKHAGAAVCQSRFDGSSLISCNDRMARLLGYASGQECVSSLVPAAVYVDADCRARLMSQLANCLSMEGVEIEFRRKDGGQVWLRLSMCRHAGGDVIDVVATDITSAKVLSSSEKDILRHLLAGMNNKEIARLLSRSLRTIENHRAAIMMKLGVKTGIELAKRVCDCPLD